jgi:hypothetical protein
MIFERAVDGFDGVVAQVVELGLVPVVAAAATSAGE